MKENQIAVTQSMSSLQIADITGKRQMLFCVILETYLTKVYLPTILW